MVGGFFFFFMYKMYKKYFYVQTAIKGWATAIFLHRTPQVNTTDL